MSFKLDTVCTVISGLAHVCSQQALKFIVIIINKALLGHKNRVISSTKSWVKVIITNDFKSIFASSNGWEYCLCFVSFLNLSIQLSKSWSTTKGKINTVF